MMELLVYVETDTDLQVTSDVHRKMLLSLDRPNIAYLLAIPIFAIGYLITLLPESCETKLYFEHDGYGFLVGAVLYGVNR